MTDYELIQLFWIAPSLVAFLILMLIIEIPVYKWDAENWIIGILLTTLYPMVIVGAIVVLISSIVEVVLTPRVRALFIRPITFKKKREIGKKGRLV